MNGVSSPAMAECGAGLSAASGGPTGSDALSALIASRRPGWTLPQPFFTDDGIYRAELDAIWRRQWLFAGHGCEVPNAGDYFVLEVGADSIVVIRGEGGALHALHNVCRHRGSIVCTESSGNATRLVCPYHQWAYATDGSLAAARGMPPGLDRSQFGLSKVRLEEVEGLIYINLDPRADGFELARASLAPCARPQGFARARVAKIVDYRVQANWKLVWENNRECYHCNVNHPQYIKANFDHFNADDTSDAVRLRMAAAAGRLEAAWAAETSLPMRSETGMTGFPDAERGIWFSANRTPLVEGWVSESMDGRRVAPLMGDYREEDVGTLRIRTLPNFWNHSSCDHAVSTRLLPAGRDTTAVRVYWLVAAGAEEGRDYDLGRVMPFWQLTSEQDWLICERQQRGVQSSAYRPGPYSSFKEYNVDQFVQWYLKTLASAH